MFYKFIGKPDKVFPFLETGEIYSLEVRTTFFTKEIVIDKPFFCPYSSWETFYQNWEPYFITIKFPKFSKKRLR